MPRNIAAEPDPVDLYVGAQIRKIRTVKGLSQEVVAKECGVTFQQLQKYEHAGNRVSASRLHKIAKALRTQMGELLPPVDWDGHVDEIPGGSWNSDTSNALYAAISGLSLEQRKAMLHIAKAMLPAGVPA